METYDQYFEWAKERITFLYQVLDLSQMDLFKMVLGGQLVDEEEVPLTGEVPLTYLQAPKDYVHPGNTLKDQ